jgi:hypothetical protein
MSPGGKQPAMARLSLVPQKREFFVLFNQAAANTIAISQRLIELLDDFPVGRKIACATSRSSSTRATGRPTTSST